MAWHASMALGKNRTEQACKAMGKWNLFTFPPLPYLMYCGMLTIPPKEGGQAAPKPPSAELIMCIPAPANCAAAAEAEAEVGGIPGGADDVPVGEGAVPTWPTEPPMPPWTPPEAPPPPVAVPPGECAAAAAVAMLGM